MSNGRANPRKLPLRNLTNTVTSLARRSMSYSGESGFYSRTNSPMSNLAFNLSELSTGKSTPRRRLSLSNTDTPPNGCDKTNTENPLSAESGCFSGSPDFLDDSPTLLEGKKTIAFRRINSQPLPSLRLDSPIDFGDEEGEDQEGSQASKDDFVDDAASQDSGLGLDHDRRVSHSSSEDGGSTCSVSSPQVLERLPSLEDVWNSMSSSSFKAPRGKPPKRSRSMVEPKQHSEDTCSPLKYSPVKACSQGQADFAGFSKALFTLTSPQSEKKPSTQSRTSSCDDGFQELFDIEDVSGDQPESSQTVSSLLRAPILHQPPTACGDSESEDVVPELTARPLFARRSSLLAGSGCASSDSQDSTPTSGRPVVIRRAFLHRSQSVVVQSQRQSFKRCSEPAQDCTDTPPTTQTKRWRGDDSDTLPCPVLPTFPPGRKLHRCHSETEAMIKSAVSRMFDEPDLIGDTSKPYCLPTIKGKHQDLKAITPDTLSRVMAGEFDHEIEEFHILDCRYPYEFEGGHIQGALNLYTKDDVKCAYIDSPVCVKNDPNKRLVLIFHCEFSSERGPGLSRFLRKRDRETNKECYPFLHYPEMYLLEGGYKNFFQQFPHLCEPQRYLQMLDKSHSEDLRKFRAKCKSSSDDRLQSRSGLRTIKF